MDFQDSCKLIQSSEVSVYPFPHLVIDGFLSSKNLIELKDSLKFVTAKVKPKFFESEHGSKKEWKVEESITDSQYRPFQELMKFLSSYDCAKAIANVFDLNFELDGDPTFDGGGFVISPPGSFLGYHADFNFSSQVKKYRVANILLYMNENYSSTFGGTLHLLDSKSLTVEKSVEPIENRALIFLTTDKTPHGVSKNMESFSRKSFNAYFYAENNPEDTDSNPHKTLWINK